MSNKIGVGNLWWYMELKKRSAKGMTVYLYKMTNEQQEETIIC